MYFIKATFFTLAVLFLASCQDGASNRISNKSLNLSRYNIKAASGQNFDFTLEDKDVDSVYFPGLKPTAKTKNKFTFSVNKLGAHAIDVVGFDLDKNERKGRVKIEIYSEIEPELLTYKITKTLDHNTNNYTQGLEFKDGILYESTGQKGESKLIKYSFPQLEVIKHTNLDANLFGEGITILNDTIFQLTWMAKKCLMYDLDLNPLGYLSVPSKEGWGLSHINNQLLFSNGSQYIFKTDKNLAIQEQMPIYFGENQLTKLNELEYANGYLWANIYYMDQIVKIDPNTGAVLAYADLSMLRQQLNHSQAEVLNGIAYLAKDNSFLITGKYWDKMFVIEMPSALSQ